MIADFRNRLQVFVGWEFKPEPGKSKSELENILDSQIRFLLPLVNDLGPWYRGLQIARLNDGVWIIP